MWGRVIGAMLGLWLFLSPFIFGHYPERTALWVDDFIVGALAFAISLASIHHRLRHLHLAIIGLGLWLAAYGYLLGGYPNQPGHQNDIFLGLTLALTAIIPDEAEKPPRSWREFLARRAERAGPDATMDDLDPWRTERKP